MTKTLEILASARTQLIDRRKELTRFLEANKDSQPSFLEDWKNERTLCRKTSNILDDLIKKHNG